VDQGEDVPQGKNVSTRKCCWEKDVIGGKVGLEKRMRP